jgi:hypothetical protein
MSIVFCKNEDQSQVAGRPTGLLPYRWSNYFTNPIKIPPNSQVAYISSSFNLNQNGSIQENPTYMTIGVPALNMPIPIRPPERFVDNWKDEVNFLARLANEYGTDTDYNHIWEYELPVAGEDNDLFGYIESEDISNPLDPIPLPEKGGVNIILTSEDKVNTTLYPRPYTAVKFNQGFNCLGRNNISITYDGGFASPAGINTTYSLFNEGEWVNGNAAIGSLNAAWGGGVSFFQPQVDTAPDSDVPDTTENFYNTQYTNDYVVSDYDWNNISAQSLVLPDFDTQEFIGTMSSTGIKKFIGNATPIENGGGHAGVGGSSVVGAGKSGGYAIYGFGNTSQLSANTHFDEVFVGDAADVGFCGIAEQFVGVQSIPFIQSQSFSAGDTFTDYFDSFLLNVDVNTSTNPDVPEGNLSRYVFGLKIFEGGDGEGGGTLTAQAQILDPNSTLEDSKYIDVGGALDLKKLANGINSAVSPEYTFDDTNKYVLNTYNYSGSRIPAMLLFRFRWTSPYTMAIEYTLNIQNDADSYDMATDEPYEPQPPPEAGTPVIVNNPVEKRLDATTTGDIVELQNVDGAGAVASEINFYDSGGAGGGYQPNELYDITFDVGSGFQTKLIFNTWGFEHAFSNMYDRLGIQVSNDGVNFVNISGIPWLNKSSNSTPPYSSSFAGSNQNSSGSYGTDGYILPENPGQALAYDITFTAPYTFQTSFRYVKFNFISDGLVQDAGWDITIQPNTPYQTQQVDNADPRNEWVLLYDMLQDYTEGQNAFYIPSYFGDMGLVSYHIADNHTHYTKGYYDVRRAYRYTERLNDGAISSKLYTGLNEYYQFFTSGGLVVESLLQKNDSGFTTPKLVGITPEGFEGDTSAPRKTATWLVNTIKTELDRQISALDVNVVPFFQVGEPFKLEMGYILGLIKSNKNDAVVFIDDPAVPPDPDDLGFKFDGVNTIQLSDSAFSNHIQITNLPIQSQNGVVSSQNKLIYVVNSLCVNSVQTDAEYRIFCDTAPVLLWVDLNNFQEINTNRLDILITDDSNREQKLLTGTTDVVLMFRQKPPRDAGYLPNQIPVRQPSGNIFRVNQ